MIDSAGLDESRSDDLDERNHPWSTDRDPWPFLNVVPPLNSLSPDSGSTNHNVGCSDHCDEERYLCNDDVYTSGDKPPSPFWKKEQEWQILIWLTGFSVSASYSVSFGLPMVERHLSVEASTPTSCTLPDLGLQVESCRMLMEEFICCLPLSTPIGCSVH